eukprot:g4444.t1
MRSCWYFRPKPLSACVRSLGTAPSSAAEATIARVNRLFIDNEYVDAEGGATLPVVAPATGAELTTIAHASAADVDRAVQSARACFDTSGWPQAPAADRAAVLQRVADELRERTAELAEIETRDCGKPLAEAEGDIGFCADTFEYYANTAPAALADEPLAVPAGEGAGDDFGAVLRAEALGVVGAVTPWNFPLMQTAAKVAPALAAGCAMVLKPSPLASLTSLALGEIVAGAGAVSGALNVVTGGPPDELAAGGSTGQSLIDHALLDKVSFTGSGAAGQLMLRASAPHLRPTNLELGGKSAAIVFADALGDGGGGGVEEARLNALVDWLMVGIFVCAGQVCSATSRLLVQREAEAPLVARLLRAAERVRVGDPLAPGTQMGPLVSEAQRDKVLASLRRAEAEEERRQQRLEASRRLLEAKMAMEREQAEKEVRSAMFDEELSAHAKMRLAKEQERARI